MAEIEEDKFEELCRLCACYDAVQMDMFGEKARERKIIEKIHTCLPFEVKEGDPLPKSICYRCMYNLENYYDFRKGCVDAVTRLEKFVATVEEKSKCPQEYETFGDFQPSTATDEDEPNPADFLEACLVGEPVSNSSSQPAIKEENVSADDVEYECPTQPSVLTDDYTCQTCGRSFNSRGALTQHSKYHTGESEHSQIFTCHVCEKAFSSKGHLASHSKVHIGDIAERQPPSVEQPLLGQLRPFKCDLCEKSYSMAKHLWGHVSVSHKGDPMVTCQFCSRTFSTATNLEDHKRVKHATNLENTKEVDTAEDLLNDEAAAIAIVKTDKSEDEDSRMEDSVGGSITEEPAGSRRKSSKPRKIKRGPVENSSISEVKKEPSEEGESNEGVVLTCLLCEKTFNKRSLLNQHLLENHGINPDEISIASPCSGGNDDEITMAENMVEAETVFCCEVCVRDFNDRASLWLHMLYSHREEAATACGICLRVCSDNVSLMEHVYSCHPKDSLTADQKRYSCQICGRQLDSKKKLLTHVKIHNLYDNTGQIVDPESVIVLNNKYARPNLQSLLNNQVKENNQFEVSHEIFTEDGQMIMSCEICFKVFPNEEKLVKHKQNAHRNSQGPNSITSSTTYFLYFSCELCGLAHSTRTERWRHVFLCHADEPTLLCEHETCGKVFPTRALKTEHAASHHNLQGETPNTCEVCGKLWATKVNYWKHMMSVHSDCLPFICGVCLKIFCSVPNLSDHVRDRHWPLSGSDYCCDICGRPYPNKSKMSRHRKIHVLPEAEGGLPPGHELESVPVGNDKRPLEPCDQLKCNLCPEEEFQCLDDLSKHRRSAHNLVPCDLCPKFYGRSSHLWKHVDKIHKNHPDITCSVCFRTSASRSHLATHTAKHHRDESLNYVDISELSNEETVHTCVKCNKVFRKHVLMRKHMKHCVGPVTSYLPPAPSPCERCSKVFDSPVLLRKHLRCSHLLFRCELCEDVAHDSRIELMDHIRQAHAGHPGLACDYKGCGIMLRSKSDLAKHRREHRQGRPPPTCWFCGELTPNKIKLRNHLKTHHPLLTKYLCCICLITLKDFDDLRKHVNAKHKAALNKPNMCPVCVRSYSTKSKVLDHIRSHGEGFFPCDVCLKVFKSQEKQKRHMDAHYDENSEELEDEEEEVDEEVDEQAIDEVKETESLKEEEKTNDEEDDTKTEESETTKRASDDEEMREDELIDREDEEDSADVPVKRQRRTHPCIACMRTFSNTTSFLKHMKTDHPELICACGKMSENIQSHNGHLKKCVTGKKEESNRQQQQQQMEDTANKRSKSKSLEKKYLNSESKGITNKVVIKQEVIEKPPAPLENKMNSSGSGGGRREVRRVYKLDDGLCFCELCNKSFGAKRHLWQHLRRFHLKEASYACGVCLKLCKDYPSLDSHLAIEHRSNFEGEGKNFTCRVCGRYHNSRSKLEQHSVIHPGQELRTQALLQHCPHCTNVFNSPETLRKHQAAEHKGLSKRAGDSAEGGGEVIVLDHDEDSRSSSSSSSSANSSSSTSSGTSSSSTSSASSSSSSSSSSSGSSSSSSGTSDAGEGGDKGEKSCASKENKLAPLAKQLQPKQSDKTFWPDARKGTVNNANSEYKVMNYVKRSGLVVNNVSNYNDNNRISKTGNAIEHCKYNKIAKNKQVSSYGSNFSSSINDEDCVQVVGDEEEEEEGEVTIVNEKLTNSRKDLSFAAPLKKEFVEDVNLSEDSSAQSSSSDEEGEIVMGGIALQDLRREGAADPVNTANV